ncbi:MAG: thioredoxin family protein [Cyanobacteria bacterium RM1_2_2]|nr:thioredoxin family protein [Cyanobacteria bacterium RM1_2_2]
MTTSMGGYAPDFELPGVDGTVHHLARYLEAFKAVGVIIMCNHCPYVKLYLDRLKQIQTEFAGQGFTLVGINSNDDRQFPEDGFEQMKSFASEHQLNFPYLRDVTQEVARGFGADCTPHAFLIDRSGMLCYGGAIDDQPQDGDAVQQSYLRQAILQQLAGQPIQTAATRAVGCSVKWRAS